MNLHRFSPLRWIYPPVCESCQAPVSAGDQKITPFICGDCNHLISPLEAPYCLICGQAFSGDMPSQPNCGNCGDRTLGFDFSLGAYRSEALMRELMHRFKYSGQIHLARLFGTCLQRVLETERYRDKKWIVVPVPLHRKRFRERGFNQSAEIAIEMVKQNANRNLLTIHPLLRRVIHTERQAQLDREDRLTNLTGAFAISRRLKKFSGKKARFLIVDDVLTTGSTASECARVLRNNFDVEEIAAVSVLRG